MPWGGEGLNGKKSIGIIPGHEFDSSDTQPRPNCLDVGTQSSSQLVSSTSDHSAGSVGTPEECFSNAGLTFSPLDGCGGGALMIKLWACEHDLGGMNPMIERGVQW